MTNDEALTLAKQGFSANEIRALGWAPDLGGKDEKEPPTDDKEKEPPKDDKEKEPPKDDKSGNTPDVNETVKALTETVNSLTETVKALQEHNQKTAKKTQKDGTPKSADEVIKGFIEGM